MRHEYRGNRGVRPRDVCQFDGDDAASARLFVCAGCCCQVLICTGCDRGQIFCAGNCADPLASVWDSEILPMLQATPGLRPGTILSELQRRHSSFTSSVSRTLERRVRIWQALRGPEQEVILR